MPDYSRIIIIDNIQELETVRNNEKLDITSWQVSKNENFDKVSRILGVVVPAVAAALWVLLYIIGILMGE